MIYSNEDLLKAMEEAFKAGHHAALMAHRDEISYIPNWLDQKWEEFKATVVRRLKS